MSREKQNKKLLLASPQKHSEAVGMNYARWETDEQAFPNAQQ